jgi:hypothetical protein
MQQLARILFSLSLVLLGAAPAAAGTLTVDFDLSTSFLQLGPSLFLTNQGGGPPIVRGSLQLTLTDVDARGLPTSIGAEAQISDFELLFDTTSSNLPGLIRITQDPDPSHPISIFAGRSLPVDSLLMLRIGGGIPCPAPPNCTFFMPPNQLVLPITFDTMLAIDTTLPFALFLDPPRGTPSIFVQLLGTQGMQPIRLSLTGTEIRRSFVPEPAEAHILLLAFLALLCTRGRRLA